MVRFGLLFENSGICALLVRGYDEEMGSADGDGFSEWMVMVLYVFVVTAT